MESHHSTPCSFPKDTMTDETKPKSPRANKLTGVRLSVTAQGLLAGVLRDHYGLNSTTAIIETLVREKARELQVSNALLNAPRGPLTESVSPEASSDDLDEANAKQFAGLKASIARAELDRP